MLFGLMISECGGGLGCKRWFFCGGYLVEAKYNSVLGAFWFDDF